MKQYRQSVARISAAALAVFSSLAMAGQPLGNPLGASLGTRVGDPLGISLSVQVGSTLPIGLGGAAALTGIGLIVGVQLIKRRNKRK